MSFEIKIKCDRCNALGYGGDPSDESPEQLFARLEDAFGWKKQDFGHTCANCTQALEAAEDLGDSQTTTADIAHEISKGEVA